MRCLRLILLGIGAMGGTVAYPTEPSAQQAAAPGTRIDTVASYVGCYARQMLLIPEQWQISLGYRIPLPGEEVVAWTARTHVNREYLRVFIELDSVNVANASDEGLRMVSVHELLHVVTADLAAVAHGVDSLQAQVEEERLAVRAQRWLIWKGFCLWEPEEGTDVGQ